jgi:hypothetical protein
MPREEFLLYNKQLCYPNLAQSIVVQPFKIAHCYISVIVFCVN